LAESQATLSRSFARAEAAGGCLTVGDSSVIGTTLTPRVGDAAVHLRPVVTSSSCAAAKLVAAGKEASYLLKLYGKQRKIRNDSRTTSGLEKAVALLGRQFTSAETGTCLTTGDADPIELRLRTPIADVVEKLWPASAVGISLDHPSNW